MADSLHFLPKSGLGQLVCLLLLLMQAGTAGAQRYPVRLEPVVLQIQDAHCRPDACCRVSICAFRITGMADAQLQAQANRYLEQELTRSVSQRSVAGYEAYMQSIIRDFEEEKAEDHDPDADDLVGEWDIRYETQVLYNSYPLLSLAIDYSHRLSAHNYLTGTQYVNLDLRTACPVLLSDLLLPGYAARLDAIAEPYFRNATGIQWRQDLEECGIFFEDCKFHVPERFGISRTGLRFRFRLYERTIEKTGLAGFEVPYADLVPLADPLGLLQPLLPVSAKPATVEQKKKKRP